MTNFIYPKWTSALFAGLPGAALSGSIRVAFVADGYRPSREHEFLSDVDEWRRDSAEIVGKSFAGTTLDASDTDFASVGGSDLINGLVVFVDSGRPEISRLVLYLDENIPGIPFFPNGGAVTIKWHENGIFTLIQDPVECRP